MIIADFTSNHVIMDGSKGIENKEIENNIIDEMDGQEIKNEEF